MNAAGSVLLGNCVSAHGERSGGKGAQLGKPIPDNGLWIAALARRYDLPLATRDAHFTNVPRLKTLAW